MALGNMRTQTTHSRPKRFLVKAGTANSIKAGEPVIQNTGGDAEYVKSPGANVTDVSTFVGIARTTSNDTASADGFVWIDMPDAGTSYIAEAVTPSNLAAASRLTKVTIDFTSPNYKLDEDNTTGGFCQIVDYDANTLDVEFVIDQSVILNA